MGVPSSAIVYTGAAGDMPGSNRGAAYSEGLGETLNIVNQGLQDIRLYEAERKKDQQAKMKAWQDFNMEDPDVWNVDLPKIQEKVTEYKEYMKKLKLNPKIDPRNLPPDEQTKVDQMVREIKRQTNAAKVNAKIWEKDKTEVDKNPTKYDQGHAAKWAKEFMREDITPEERLRYAQSNSIFKNNVNLVDVVEKIDELTKEEEIKVNGRTMIKKDPEKFKNLLGIYFKDQVGMGDYEALLPRYGNDEVKLYEEAVSMFKDMNPGKPKPVTRSGTTTKKKDDTPKYGTGKWGDLSIEVEEGAPIEYFAPGFNRMAITKNNQELAPLSGIAGGRTNGYRSIPVFKPTGFFYAQNGDVSVIGYELDSQGDPVLDEATGEPKEIWVSYEDNKPKFKSYLDGFDPRVEFETRNGSASTGTSSGGQTPEDAANEILNELYKQ